MSGDKRPAKPELIEIGRRLAQARERAHLTQGQLAERLGVTVAAVSNWERGRNEIERRRWKEVAQAVRATVLQIFIGVEDELAIGGIEFRTERGRPVPKVDLQTAILDRFPQQPSLDSVHTYFDCGPRAFAIDLTDKSNLPKFEPGDAVIIDPDERPLPNDMVLASLKPSERPVFRRYEERRDDKGQAFIALVALNPAWKEEYIRTSDDGQIVGVMTEHCAPRR